MEDSDNPEELTARQLMSPSFFLFALLSVLSTSLIGTLCNTNLLFRFLSRPPKTNGFQKICTVRSFTNSIICGVYMFWVVPLVMMDWKFSELNNWVNRSIGLASCTWSYFLNSLLQVCLSCNRFYVLYFPFGIQRLKSKNVSRYSIIFCIIAITLFSAGAVPKGCGFVFDPNIFLWRDETLECAGTISVVIPPIVFSTTFITHGFNLAIIIRLIKQKSVGVNEQEARKRRRKWMVMFTQCFIQDCLQLCDMLNSYYISHFSNDLRLQFYCWTLSLILVTMLDGIVMFICHSDVYPNCLKRILERRKGRVLVINNPQISSIVVT